MSRPGIGILGAGQLGQMLAEAAYRLNLPVRFLDPSQEEKGGVRLEVDRSPFEDREALAALASWADALTYEFENVPAHALEPFQGRVWPPPPALDTIQDRLTEKELFRSLDIPTPNFRAVESKDDLADGLKALASPAVVKTRRFGYDGKGQWRLSSPEEIEKVWREADGRPLIMEAFVPFQREVSLIAVCSRNGEKAFYPLVENHHHQGILRISQAPDPRQDEALWELACGYAAHMIERLKYVGVMAVEFFHHGDELLANEIAPRVHNSGHWSIEGAVCSQFENHLRAIAGLPLGDTSPRGVSIMLNLIGEVPPLESLLAIPGVALHDYGKKPRPGRKVGHVTVCGEDWEETWGRANRVRNLLSPDGFKGR